MALHSLATKCIQIHWLYRAACLSYADPQPSYKETEPLTTPFPDPVTMQGDELSSIISPYSWLIDYIGTIDEGLEKEDKPACEFRGGVC